MHSSVRGGERTERTRIELMKILILLSLLITLVTALRINNKQALAQLITSQIKTRIQSGLVFNISASVSDKQINSEYHCSYGRM